MLVNLQKGDSIHLSIADIEFVRLLEISLEHQCSNSQFGEFLLECPELLVWTLQHIELGSFSFLKLKKLNFEDVEHFTTEFVDQLGASLCRNLPKLIDSLVRKQTRDHFPLVMDSTTVAIPSMVARIGLKDVSRKSLYIVGTLLRAYYELSRQLGGCHKMAKRLQTPKWIVHFLDKKKSGKTKFETKLADAFETANHLLVAPRKKLGRRDRSARKLAREIIRRRQKQDVEIPSVQKLFSNAIARNLDHRQLQVDFEQRLQQEKIKSLKEFAYGASHEINNPLGNIATRAQSLLKREEDAYRKKQLLMIKTQAYRAHEMVSDLMLFANPPDIRLTQLKLIDIVKTAVDELTPVAELHNITIKCSGSDKKNFGDSTHLCLMVRSIIENAIEAIGVDGEIIVNVGEAFELDQSGFLVTVSDNGPGIDSKQIKHIFDPFYSGREAGRGLGFGLCKAWTIAKLHDGSIDVESSSKGTTFTIVLPNIESSKATYKQASHESSDSN